MGRTAVVTGVCGSLGAKVANALLADSRFDRVVGVDSAAPHHPVGRMEFHKAELCDGSVRSLIRESGADTVLHLNLAATRTGTSSRHAARESNALGTMQLLSACQDSTTVRRLVVRSSTAVYGASPAAEAVEMERYVDGLARRRPDISVAVLRFANIIGPSVESPLTQYLGRAIVPTVRGDDPRMQFLHEDDGVEAIRRMLLSRGTGVFDVAATGALPLSQCLRRVGRSEVAVPERGLRVLGSLARRGRLGEYTPERIRQLCYGRVVDCSRLERALDWRPRYTSLQAFESFLAEHHHLHYRRSRVRIRRLTHRVRSAMAR